MEEVKLSTLIGAAVAFASAALTALTAAYIYKVFWVGEALDYGIEIGGHKIPPETYAFLLLALWSAAQRLQVHLRPRNAFFAWMDALTSLGFGLFIVLTIMKVWVIGNPNPTYIPMLAGFLIAAIVDLIMNGRHRFDRGEEPLIAEKVTPAEVAGEAFARLLTEKGAIMIARAGEGVEVTWPK